MGFRNSTADGLRIGRSISIGMLGLVMVLGIVAAYVPKAGAVSDYRKYAWSDRVYRVTGPNSAVYVTWAAYVAAGYPHVAVTGWIPGTQVVRYLTNRDEIYALQPDRYDGHHLTFEEWGAMGYPTPTRFSAGFVRINDGPAVYRLPSCVGIGGATIQLSYSQWASYGYPNTVSYGYLPSCVN